MYSSNAGAGDASYATQDPAYGGAAQGQSYDSYSQPYGSYQQPQQQYNNNYGKCSYRWHHIPFI